MRVPLRQGAMGLGMIMEGSSHLGSRNWDSVVGFRYLRSVAQRVPEFPSVQLYVFCARVHSLAPAFEPWPLHAARIRTVIMSRAERLPQFTVQLAAALSSPSIDLGSLRVHRRRKPRVLAVPLRRRAQLEQHPAASSTWPDQHIAATSTARPEQPASTIAAARSEQRIAFTAAAAAAAANLARRGGGVVVVGQRRGGLGL